LLAANRIVRLNSDGTIDVSFAPTGTGLNNTVSIIGLDSNGKITIGGVFTSYNGTTANRIARLNANGTLDTDFVTYKGLNNNVLFKGLKVAGDKIYLGGNFGSYNNVETPFFAVLDYDGSLSNTGIALSPGIAQLLPTTGTSFSVINGTPPYTYAIESGGGTINSTTGLFTAPNATGTTVVKVTDSFGNVGRSYVYIHSNTLSVNPTTLSLPLGASTYFSATGGLSPYTFEILSGVGGSITSAGLFTAPTNNESIGANITIRVSDQSGLTATSTVTINGNLSVSPSMQTLLAGASLSLVASGGISPYTFALLSGAGSVGAISGVYTASTNFGASAIRVTDSLGQYTDALITTIGTSSTLAMNPATLTLAPNNIFALSASGGSAPYSFAISSGGGSINSNGKYTAPGTAGSATIVVTDAAATTATTNITINSSLAFANTLTQIGTNSNFTFTASGGVSPYTFSILSGGGTIGSISGAYSAPATTGKAAILLIDQLGNTAKLNFDIVEPIKLNLTSLTIERTRAYQFTARGGALPYTFSTTSGSISTSSGLYTASTSAGTATITVTDKVGQIATAAVTITDLRLANLSYPLSSYQVIAGSPLTPLIVPTYAGDNPTFSISPTLPSGLNFNTATGVISGIATSVSANTLYTVTATNSTNMITTSFYLQVNASNAFTIDSPTEGETISSYKVLRGNCLIGQTLTITTSSDLKASATTAPCTTGSYSIGLTSTNNFGVRWVKVAQINITLTRNIYNANTGINNNYGTMGNLPLAFVEDTISGKIYVGGYYGNSQLANSNKNSSRLIRLNSDGSQDTSFLHAEFGFNSSVQALAIDSNGKILVGGDFTAYNGVTSNYIARLNVDGTLDTSFTQSGLGLSYSVYSIAIDSNGKILVGGYFGSYNGIARNYIARLNTDGTLDNNFAQTGTGLNDGINSMHIESTGKIIVGGNFTSYNGTSVNRIARLNSDGSLDTSFASASTGFNSFVKSLDIDSNGKIAVGGYFTSYNGTPMNYVARLNTDGSIDTSFTPTGTGVNYIALSLKIDSNNKVVLGGYFSSYDINVANYAMRLNSDGTFDTGFASPGSLANNVVSSVFIQQNGKILLGGYFSAYAGVATDGLVRVNTDGTIDTGFTPSHTGFNNFTTSLDLDTNGKLIVGGDFTAYNGITRNRIARINNDGTLDTSFTPTGIGLNQRVNTLELDTNGKIIIGGYFTSYNGVTRNNIARLNSDGTLDTSFVPQGTGLNAYVESIAIESTGKIVVGGYFGAYDSTNINGIARLNADGSLDTSFAPTGTGLNNGVKAVAIDTNGKILVGGGFTSYNGAPSNYIARLNSDGSLDTSFAPTGTGLNNAVQAIAIESSGKILVGGNFTSYNGTIRYYIARLNSDGSLDSSFAPTGNGFDSIVYSITITPSEKIIVGGSSNYFNGIRKNRIIGLNYDGSIDNNFNVGEGFLGEGVIFNSAVKATDTRIYIAGKITAYNNILTPYLAALDIDGSLANTGITLNSTSVSIPSSGTYSFSGLNGNEPYTYTVITGSGTINSTTGVFTAPVSAGTTIIQITDNIGLTAKAAITTSEILAISPVTSTRSINQALSLATTGGIGPYSYQIISGGGYIDSSGYFIAPNYPCSSIIRVTDIFGHTADATITINP
jgi:uncharacterized delta-60 repeat protein